ncbi:hypothetical protein D3C85_1236970 [compost metagenome]
MIVGDAGQQRPDVGGTGVDGAEEAIPSQMLLGTIGAQIHVGELGIPNGLLEGGNLGVIAEIHDARVLGHSLGGHIHAQGNPAAGEREVDGATIGRGEPEALPLAQRQALGRQLQRPTVNLLFCGAVGACPVVIELHLDRHIAIVVSSQGNDLAWQGVPPRGGPLTSIRH